MKTAATAIVVLVLAAFTLAQQPASPPTQNPPAGQSGPPQGASQAPAAVGKRPPQAKTQPEFDAYKTAAASTDPAALEKAADDFAAKFPDSELTPLLYRAALRGYQNANNGDKLMEMGQKILKGDPDDPEALVDVAEVMTERTRDTDLDKDQRLDQAAKYAQHALETVDTDLPPGLPAAQVDTFKGLMRSNAYSVLGTLQFNKEKYADAESSFRKSIDAFPSQPDPVVILRLALSLDKQGKYPEALKEANHAVEMTQEGTPAGNLSRRERDRLAQLTGGAAPASNAPTSKPAPPAGTTPPQK
jgi:tetratricopeptide (TPR) repeat protein